MKITRRNPAGKTGVVKVEWARTDERGQRQDEEAVVSAQQEVLAVKQEAPAALKQEAPAALKQEAPAALKQEAPAALKQEAPAALKQEAPAALKQEAPAALKQEAPAALKQEARAALKQEAPAAVKKAAPKRKRAGSKSSALPILFQTMTGKSLTMTVQSTDTVESLKVSIQEREGIPPDQMRLIFAGVQLEDALTLADCGIRKHSKVHLVLRMRGCCCGCGSMGIFVHTFSGEAVPVRVEPADKVDNLKAQLENLLGIPHAEQRLISAGGDPLCDEGTLASYRIREGSVVELTTRGRRS